MGKKLSGRQFVKRNSMSNSINLKQEQDRILSIDFFRGFTMCLRVVFSCWL